MATEQLNGWVALYRQFLGWEWYKDPVTKAVFLHLLLVAAWRDGEFEGEPVKRGQAIVGRRSLAKDLGLSERQVRTALSRLESTHEVTLEPSHRWTRVTINNFNAYQDVGATETTHQTTHESTTSKQVLTINSNNKSIYISEIVAYLNKKTGKNYRITSRVSATIAELAAAGYTLDDCRNVVDLMVGKWKGTKYEPGLAPKSLFQIDNFDSYLNESGAACNRSALVKEYGYLQIKYNEVGLTPGEASRLKELEEVFDHED